MKNYKIKLLTQQGIIELTIPEGTDLEKLTAEIVEKCGNFTMLSSELI